MTGDEDTNTDGDNSVNAVEDTATNSANRQEIREVLREEFHKFLEEMRAAGGGPEVGRMGGPTSNIGIRENTTNPGVVPGGRTEAGAGVIGSGGEPQSNVNNLGDEVAGNTTAHQPVGDSNAQTDLKSLVKELMAGGEDEKRQQVKSDSLKTFKFDGNDYGVWSSQMKRILKHAGLWDTIITRLPPIAPVENWGDDSDVDIENDPPKRKKKTFKSVVQESMSEGADLKRSELTVERWKKLNNEAESTLMANVTKQYMLVLNRCANARDMWLKLKKIFAEKSRANVMKAYEDYHRCVQRRGQNLQIYISTQESLVYRLESLGEEIDEEDQIRRILSGLLPEYNVIRTTLENMEELSLVDVTARLLSHESLNKRISFVNRQQNQGRANQASGSGAGHPAANFVKKGKFQKKKVNPTWEKKKNLCFKCGEEGHKSWECKQGDAETKKKICYNCKQEGHLRANCPEYQANQSTFNSNSGVSEDMDQDDSNPKRKKSNRKFAAVARLVVSPLARRASLQDQMTSRSAWIIDSGATHHMTNQLEALVEVKELTDPKEVSLADHSMVGVTMEGTVPLKLRHGGSTVQFDLGEVLYVPDLANNLFSVAHAMECGISVLFDAARNTCKFLQHGVVIGTGMRREGLWWLNGETMVTPGQAQWSGRRFAANSNYETREFMSELSLWHHRFGHLGEDALIKIAKQGVVRDLPSTLKGVSMKNKCAGCAEGKQHKESFSKLRPRAENPLDLVHADTMGPIKPLSIGGNRYILVLVDDYTRMVWVFPVDNKAVIAGVVIDWIDKIMVSKERRVKMLRTDNGGEFTSNVFENQLKDRLIVHDLTLPYTPQHNGVVERANRTLVEMARSMMCAAQADKSFWGEAILTAAHIKNRVISKSVLLNGKEVTPYELWFGVKPTVAHLKIWGCDVTVNVTERPSKFQEKVWHGIFVGYSNSLGFRIWDPIRKFIVETRNLRFNEMLPRRPEVTRTQINQFLMGDTDGELNPTGGYDGSSVNIWEQWNPELNPYLEENLNQPLQPENGHVELLWEDYKRRMSLLEKQQALFEEGKAPKPDFGLLDFHAREAGIINTLPQVGDQNPFISEIGDKNFQMASESGLVDKVVMFEEETEQDGLGGALTSDAENKNNLKGQISEKSEDENFLDRFWGGDTQMELEETPVLSPMSPTDLEEEGDLLESAEEPMSPSMTFRREPVEPRRSQRVAGPPTRLIYTQLGNPRLNVAREFSFGSGQCVKHFVGVAALECNALPKTFSDAVSGVDAELWKKGIQDEMDALVKMNTWELVKLPHGRKALGCKWVLTIKNKSDGTKRYKARLVVKGFMQESGIDYQETFAPVIKIQTLRILLGIANQRCMTIHQMDVKTAFLNGVLEEDIYMVQPEGFRVKGEGKDLVCKLKRSLYGLKQSPRVWNKTFDKFLLGLGFVRCLGDEATYVKGIGKSQVYLGVYIDDLLVMSEVSNSVMEVKQALAAKFEMADLGEVSTILGIRVTRDKELGTLCLDQTQYVGQVLAKFGMADSKPVVTPLVVGVKFSSSMCAQTMDEKDEMKVKPYRSVIGSLMYLMICTRPDIAASIGILSRYLENPGPTHWDAVKRVMRYLKLTAEKCLMFKRQANLEFDGFVDADWGGCVDTRKSTGAYVFRLNGAAISWCSKRQTSVALSSCEAEYMAACQAGKEAVWLKNFLLELNIKFDKSFVIYSDSQSALQLMKNPVFHSRTKHIGIQYHFVRELIWSEIITFVFCSTEKQWADMLTKAVPRVKLVTCMFNIGLVSQVQSAEN